MRSFPLFIAALLIIARPVSAFVPGRVPSCGCNVASDTVNFDRLNVIMGGKPAKSKEEDMELTRAIIMKHIASTDDTVVDDGDEEESQPVASSSSSSSSTDRDEKPGKREKIKSLGRKVKKKVKKKLKGKGSLGLTIAPAIISAFAPERMSSGIMTVASNTNFARLTVQMTGKRAKSKEDDIDLTRSIIMKHITSTDDTVVDDEDDSRASVASPRKSGGGSTDKVEGKRQPLKRIRAIGSKIKDQFRVRIR